MIQEFSLTFIKLSLLPPHTRFLVLHSILEPLQAVRLQWQQLLLFLPGHHQEEQPTQHPEFKRRVEILMVQPRARLENQVRVRRLAKPWIILKAVSITMHGTSGENNSELIRYRIVIADKQEAYLLS